MEVRAYRSEASRRGEPPTEWFLKGLDVCSIGPEVSAPGVRSITTVPRGRFRTRLLLVALACAAALLMLPFAGQALAMKCDGKKVTIMGTPGPDHIVGKRASDVIYGGGGDDVITGGPHGKDTICGGPRHHTDRRGPGLRHPRRG